VSGPADQQRRRLPAAAAFCVLTLLGLAALVAAMVPVGPDWLDGVGAVTIAVTFTAVLAARTGGRPIVFSALALAVGVVTLATDEDYLRTGAAVMTCVIAAVLGVMATVPAVRFLHVVREVVIAMVIGGVGALATVGFEPAIAVARFEYATFALALAGAFFLVYRLGAGLHGLGRRGAVVVSIGSVVLVVTLLYAELLRRYGTPGLVESLLDVVRWSRSTLGAFPRPIETVLGIPALAWGCHMRARRRQGWWVCAFGVAATSAAANSLVNPAITIRESGLSVLYGVLVGLVIGVLVIRLDLAITGPPGGRRGRRARVAEGAAAVRPEPPRTHALL
jgi:hypothetical protein